MSKKRKRKKKLRKLMAKRDLCDVPALVICVGKDCCDRRVSRALADEARAYVAAAGAPLRVELAGCLHVCKKGPIVATYPDFAIHKRATADDVKTLIDEETRGQAGRRAGEA